MEGTGSALSFGLITEVGTYTALGSNASCEQLMYEQIEVMVYDLPIPIVLGEEMVCDFSEETYEVADNAGSTYTWEVTGGTIISGQGTYMVTIMWDGEGNGSISVEEVSVEGCDLLSEMFEVLIDDCTSIEENNEIGLEVYPNPASSDVNVLFERKSGEPNKIFIYNLMGQVVYENELNGTSGIQKLSINIAQFPTGLYFLKIQSGSEKMATKQFLKK